MGFGEKLVAMTPVDRYLIDVHETVNTTTPKRAIAPILIFFLEPSK
tara:strand:+ start:20501 stop:20638 length:138 start_codon:yes stop_codon:yes gene_type:complete